MTNPFKSRTIIGLLLLEAVAIAFGFGFVWARFDAATPVLKPSNHELLNRGQQIYAAECASCHGSQLEGQANWRARDNDGYLPAPPHDASGHTWHHSDEKLFELTKHGLSGVAGGDYKSRMPDYDGVLADSDIIAVLSFIKSRWSASIQKRHDQVNSAASRLFQSDS